MNIKTAIVFSGLLRGNYEFIIREFKEKIDYADFFFVTWDDQPHSELVDVYFKQPLMKYNPGYKQLKQAVKYLRENKKPYDIENNKYSDIIQESYIKNIIYRSSQRHRTKQILCHTMAIDHFDLSNNYDVIIRVRYDTIVTEQFFEVLKNCIIECYEKNIPIAFIPTNDQWTGENANKKGYILNDDSILADILIVHRSDMFSTEEVWKLHETKKLEGSESGWYQIISNPYNKNPIVYANYVKIDHVKENDNIESFFTYARRTISPVETVDIVKNEIKINIIKGNNMKVAVLYSGTIPHWCDAHSNIQRFREMLPKADFYFTSWDNQPICNFVNRYYKEPMHHYNAAAFMLKNYIKVYRKFKESNWDTSAIPFVFRQKSPEMTKQHLEDVINCKKYYRNQNKQHIIYSLAYRDFIKKEHDVVIRMRYDSVVMPELRDIIQSLCERSYHDRRPLGFHHFTESLLDLLNEKPPHQQTNIHDTGVYKSLRDFMIIHRRDMFDPNFALYLWETKALTFAEAAWYQILCEPYHVRQEHYTGYVKLQKQIQIEEEIKRQYSHLDLEKDRKILLEHDKNTVQAITGIYLELSTHADSNYDFIEYPWQPHCFR